MICIYVSIYRYRYLYGHFFKNINSGQKGDVSKEYAMTL